MDSRMQNETQTAPTVRNSYFMDKIFPTIVGSLIVGGIAFVAMYFRFESLARAVDTFPATYVRQDVLNEALTPIKEDTSDLQKDMDIVKNDTATIKGILQGSKGQ